MRTLPKIFFLIFVMASAPHAEALLSLTLTDDDIAALPPQARTLVEQASDELNHADHVDALRHLLDAAREAPDCVRLQFSLFDVVREHFRAESPEEGRSHLRAAELAMERVLRSPHATEVQRLQVAHWRDWLGDTLDSWGETHDHMWAASSAFLRAQSQALEQQARELQRQTEAIRAQEQRAGDAGNGSGPSPWLPARRH